MKAKYSVTVRFNIVQENADVDDLLDLHLVAHTAADAVVDIVTDDKTVASYTILSKKVDVK